MRIGHNAREKYYWMFILRREKHPDVLVVVTELRANKLGRRKAEVIDHQ